ncbi:hypothetical protein AR457_38530 [Streptomyces agglomeratus]|nr:hypothetical protein AR457_38530 [Streptomyces agglomeratus]
MVEAGAERRIGRLVQQFTGPVRVEQDGRWVSGAAVDDQCAAGVDEDLDRGCGRRAVQGAGVQTEDLQGLGGTGSGTDDRAQGAAEHAHDGRGVQAVADNVSDRRGVAVGWQVDDVVPVAAHVK